jgi:arylsulfatase A-like enzyme
VRGPGVAAGRTETAIALNIDFAPTFAAIAQADAPEVDGRSLYRVLMGKAGLRDWRKDFLVELYGPEDAGITEYRALRTTDRLYVEYVTGEKELYDLKKDPSELDSLAKTAEEPELAQLAARLALLKSCRGESCRS